MVGERKGEGGGVRKQGVSSRDIARDRMTRAGGGMGEVGRVKGGEGAEGEGKR